MIVTTKSLGSRKPLFADFSVPIPPEVEDHGDGGFTLRQLITQVVRHEVDQFKKRQSDRQFIRVLSAQEIETAAENGKVDMGGTDVPRRQVDEAEAIDTALIAFEDGLYLVVIDEQRYSELDETVFISDDSQVTFIRLTMLSGA